MSTAKGLIVDPRGQREIEIEDFKGFPPYLEWGWDGEYPFWRDLLNIMERGRAPGRYRVYIQYCGPGYHYWNAWIQNEIEVYGPGPGMVLVGFVQVKGEQNV